MFQRTYKVNGVDVNDFMVMQNAAYLNYATKIVETFLFVNGFTKLKMNTLKVGLQKKNDIVKQYKPLLFTQSFSVELEFKRLDSSEQKMSISINFYNDKEDLCTTVKREIYWFDYSSWTALKPPKTIAKYFLENKENFKKAV